MYNWTGIIAGIIHTGKTEFLGILEVLATTIKTEEQERELYRLCVLAGFLN